MKVAFISTLFSSVIFAHASAKNIRGPSKKPFSSRTIVSSEGKALLFSAYSYDECRYTALYASLYEYATVEVFKPEHFTYSYESGYGDAYYESINFCSENFFYGSATFPSSYLEGFFPESQKGGKNSGVHFIVELPDVHSYNWITGEESVLTGAVSLASTDDSVSKSSSSCRSSFSSIFGKETWSDKTLSSGYSLEVTSFNLSLNGEPLVESSFPEIYASYSEDSSTSKFAYMG